MSFAPQAELGGGTPERKPSVAFPQVQEPGFESPSM